YKNKTVTDLVQDSHLDITVRVPVAAVNFLMSIDTTMLSQIPTIYPDLASIVVNKNIDANILSQIPTVRPDLTSLVIKGLKEFQANFPQLLKNGYVVQQGKYYVSNWNIQQKNILVNNQSLAKLLAKMKQNTEQDYIEPIAPITNLTVN